MKIDFAPSSPKPIDRLDLLLSGRKVGEVEKTELDDKYRWHACIKLGPLVDGVLIQGFADTAEGAVAAAIETGRKNAALHARLIDEFAESVL